MYLELSSTAQLDGTVRRADGSARPVAIPYLAMDASTRLRALMGEPERRMVHSGLPAQAPTRIDFDHDQEPAWSTPTNVGHYLEEWSTYLRNAQHTPGSLAERLSQAREWSAAAER